MQKFTDIGSLPPTKPAPASMWKRSLAIFSVLVLFAACRSHRHAAETISLEQRHQQRGLQIQDTLWQSIRLYLEDVSIEVTEDTVRSLTNTFVLKASRADLNIDKHSGSTVNALSKQDDTLVFNHSEESHDTTNMSHPNQKAKPNRFLLGMLFPLALIGLILIVLMFIRPWKH